MFDISPPGNTDYAETPVSGKHPAQSRGRGALAEEQCCNGPEAGESLLFIPRNTIENQGGDLMYGPGKTGRQPMLKGPGDHKEKRGMLLQVC